MKSVAEFRYENDAEYQSEEFSLSTPLIRTLGFNAICFRPHFDEDRIEAKQLSVQTTRQRQRSSTGHALAIARWESNRKAWLDGEFFGLTSKRRDLQDLVGDGGTLWIAVSRRGQGGYRMYSLSFRLDKCRRHIFRSSEPFGRYGIIADPDRSTLFAANDARLLLLALRFEPFLPIDDQVDRMSVIGQSIQTPRGLSAADVKLLEDFGADADRWSVFVSYQRTTVDTKTASLLSSALQANGVNVFRDQEALRPGQVWWPTLQRAISRSRLLVLVVGRSTHESTNVRQEVSYAIENGIEVVPLVTDGSFESWADIPLHTRHAIVCKPGYLRDAIGNILLALRRKA